MLQNINYILLLVVNCARYEEVLEKGIYRILHFKNRILPLCILPL